MTRSRGVTSDDFKMGSREFGGLETVGLTS